MSRLATLFGILASLASLVPASAQAPATVAATAPATRPARRMVLPPGFVRIEVGQRVAVAEPADESWLREALAQIAPATRPSTMPADLVRNLTDRREELIGRMTEELALPDPSAATALIDDRLLPTAREYAELQIPVIYLVTTRDRLKALLKGGWEDPHFRYNRAADDIIGDDTVNLTIHRPMDDVVVPVLYEPAADDAARRKELEQVMPPTERTLAMSVAVRSQVDLQLALGHFVEETVLAPLKLGRDRQWFAQGVAGLLSIHYLALVNGMSPDTLYRDFTFEHPRNPVKSAPIDLSHPIDVNDLRPQYVPLYEAAMRRKATRVVHDWLEIAPPDALPKTITALREKPPQTAEELLKTIERAGGISVAEDVKPK